MQFNGISYINNVINIAYFQTFLSPKKKGVTIKQ